MFHKILSLRVNWFLLSPALSFTLWVWLWLSLLRKINLTYSLQTPIIFTVTVLFYHTVSLIIIILKDLSWESQHFLFLVNSLIKRWVLFNKMFLLTFFIEFIAALFRKVILIKFWLLLLQQILLFPHLSINNYITLYIFLLQLLRFILRLQSAFKFLNLIFFTSLSAPSKIVVFISP